MPARTAECKTSGYQLPTIVSAALLDADAEAADWIPALRGWAANQIVARGPPGWSPLRSQVRLTTMVAAVTVVLGVQRESGVGPNGYGVRSTTRPTNRLLPRRKPPTADKPGRVPPDPPW